MKNAVALIIIGFAAVVAGVRMELGAYVLLGGVFSLVAGINYAFLLLVKRDAEKFDSDLGSIPPNGPVRKSAA